MGALEEIATASAEVRERVGNAVVAIGRSGRGAGIVIGEGLVVTNAHNLRDSTTTVTFADGRQVQGEVAGAAVETDLVVLRADTQGAAVAQWAPSLDGNGGLRAGTPVFALANPQGRGVRATFGTVTAVDQQFRGPGGRRITGAFEHTAPLSRGSSGGPVVDLEGRLLGINTNRLGEGFYLALTGDAALRDRIAALGRGETRPRVQLGVGLAPSAVANRLRAAVGLDERDGLLVQAVADNSPAAVAGVQRGDLLVEAAGAPLSSPDDLLDRLDTIEPGASLELRVVRGTEERSVVVGFDSDSDSGDEAPDPA
jgi:serine protease Do